MHRYATITNILETVMLLYRALRHAEKRLNEIPHRYEDTNWQLFRDAFTAADSLLGKMSEPERNPK